MQHNSTFPIKLKELEDLRDEASSYLKSIQWEQGNRARNKDKSTKQQESILLYLSKATGGSSVMETTSVSKTISLNGISFKNLSTFPFLKVTTPPIPNFIPQLMACFACFKFPVKQ